MVRICYQFSWEKKKSAKTRQGKIWRNKYKTRLIQHQVSISKHSLRIKFTKLAKWVVEHQETMPCETIVESLAPGLPGVNKFILRHVLLIGTLPIYYEQ